MVKMRTQCTLIESSVSIRYHLLSAKLIIIILI
jgi:hypothetical protein